ncbi:MAG: CDP-alcohol phosphatidyltransferase family protein [Rhodospirillaceae bacterium]|nr:CDP-alcohol phosphatidyltransferase family protein [Rhodospirillaceae bacterium]MDD9916019.1 CDP-alcohol phosphatidyltransferase family protein [Rhodospirillaceae bacterium]MDD9929661.1 CDP-alcohol phosphatidyltransferase family protein [Rhodospirillaceae bacterium]
MTTGETDGRDSARARITLADVKASINPNIPTHFTVKYFGRPIADLMTPASCAMGLRANGVTFWRTLIAFFGLFLLAWPGPFWLAAAAAGIFYFCFVLDCLDGNLARLYDEASYWGKFMDGLADFVFVQGAPFFAGIGLWLRTDDGHALVVGAAVTATTLVSQMIRARLSFMREWMEKTSGPLTDAENSAAEPARKVQAVAAELYVGGTFFAPLILFGADAPFMWAYLLFLLVFQFVVELVWIGGSMREARHILGRHRVSKHAPTETKETDG